MSLTRSPRMDGSGRRRACPLKPFGRRRGAALIVSIAVLVVLALLATIFTSLTAVERNVSRNYVDIVRARMLAESGVHHAIGSLRAYLEGGGNFTGSMKSDLAWMYRGEDFNLNGVLDAGERDAVYPPDFPADGRADTRKVPLEVVPAPSFAVEINPGYPSFNPRLLNVDGFARVGISGALDSGTYGRNGDIFTLRVVDASALLYVNDINPNLPRILNNLCDQLRIPRYGPAIWAGRPYGSILEIKKAVPVPADFEKLSLFLATAAWVDDKVVNPVPLSQYEMTRAGSLYADPAFPGPGPKYVRPVEGGRTIYRYGHGRTAMNEDRSAEDLRFCLVPDDPDKTRAARSRARGAVYGWDELNPQWIETTSRAPLDLNTAPRELLIAVLQDLQGFFAMETPTNIPDYGYDFIHRLQFDPLVPNVPNVCNRLGCRPPDDGWTRSHVDELASLYATMKVKGPGASGDGPDAGVLADAILARRNDRNPWQPVDQPGRNPRVGGAFRSWEDFHQFCDDLVGLNREIWDTRPMWSNFPTRRLYASRAMADVLKANFNPNLHLNELNPNTPLQTLVDKTDLIHSSTEGALRPMGVFRIDSLGRILQPDPPGGDAFTSAANETVAAAQMTAMIRLYDVYHETHQKDFYAGAFGPASGVPTNYGLAVESGPEPHNGPAARENDWEGYVQLATNGGVTAPVPNDAALRPTVPNHAADRDAFAAPALPDSLLHAHYMNDFDLNAAKSNARPLTRRLPASPPARGFLYNHPDPTEASALPTSPYCPAFNPARYRLARSYRLPPVPPGRTATAPARNRYAPSDLRVDGAYSERHGALVYDPQAGENWNEGMVSYWIKPGHDVTNAGKARVYFNLNRMHATNLLPGFGNAGMRRQFDPTPFLHAFIPHQLYDLSRGTPYAAARFTWLEGPPAGPRLDFQYASQDWWHWPGPGNWTDSRWGGTMDGDIRRAVSNPDAQSHLLEGGRDTMIGFRPRSFAFGYAYLAPTTTIKPPPPSGATTPWVREMAGQEIAVMTDPLNHAGHPHHGRNAPPRDRYSPDLAAGGDVFDQGHWTHVVLSWNMKGPAKNSGWDTDDTFMRHVQIRVNGRVVQVDRRDMSYWSPRHFVAPPFTQRNDYRTTWDSFTGSSFPWDRDEYGHTNPIRIGNPSALHPRHTVKNPQDGYENNYPADATIDEFYLWNRTVDMVGQNALTSAAQSLFRRGRYYRGLRPQFTSAPVDLTSFRPRRRPAPPVSGLRTVAAGPPFYRLYGVYWTDYVSPIYNYAANPPTLLRNIRTQFQVRLDPASPFTGPPLLPNGPPSPVTWFTDEQYSKVLQDVRDPSRFQYRFEFANTSPGSPTLLETPILDDVWFMYGSDQTEILEWTVY